MAATRAVVLTLTWIGGHVGHEAGDYLIQRDIDAQHKQHRTGAGRRSLATHVASYTLAQTVAKALLYRAADVRVPLRAQLVGALAEGLLHAVIDDGRLLRRFAQATGKKRFHDCNSGGVNGRMLLDQAAHKSLQLPVGALLTTLLAA